LPSTSLERNRIIDDIVIANSKFSFSICFHHNYI
jgi:hypothetical protein